LAFHVYLVYVVWDHLRDVLTRVSRLPLALSFQRLPEKVARWFFESPIPRHRSLMVGAQAAALAERCEPPIISALNAAFDVGLTDCDWNQLRTDLGRFNDLTTPEKEPKSGGWRELTRRLQPVVDFFTRTGGWLMMKFGPKTTVEPADSRRAN